MNTKRMLMAIVPGLAVVGLLGFGMTRDPRDIPSPLPGRPAPTFALRTMDSGDTVRLADHRGGIVVVNFWASWCLACRAEHEELRAGVLKYAAKGVKFYGILYNDDASNGRRWIEERGGQEWPTLLDPGARTAIDYGVYGVPETYIIGPDGKVLHKEVGPITVARLDEVLGPVLAAPVATGAQR